jgi:hypothetical protein
MMLQIDGGATPVARRQRKRACPPQTGHPQGQASLGLGQVIVRVMLPTEAPSGTSWTVQVPDSGVVKL